ncbi:MAG TPA: hypothetical protein VJ371_23925, partial [Streptosporangiaceae bacterium]|nr:hypothetical protein [Streptosporangiaceae bacterium]
MGAKLIQGTPGTLAIIVTVVRKRPLAEVPVAERIPEEIEGFKTDVIQGTPPMRILAGGGGAAAPDRAEYPVLRGGIQLQDGGTLSFIARTTGADPRFVLVTCQHVLYESALDVNPGCAHSVGQPAGHDCCECMDPICNALSFLINCRVVAHERRPAIASHFVDAATADLVAGTQWAPEIQDQPAPVPITGKHPVLSKEIDQANAPTHPYLVWKRGRTTLKTDGWIHQVDYTGTADASGSYRRAFDRAILVHTQHDAFVDSGDSGSALLNSSNQVVGILFAKHTITLTLPTGQRTFVAGIASAIDHVESELGVELMTQVNTPAGVQTVPDHPPRRIGDFPPLPTGLALRQSPQPGDGVEVRASGQDSPPRGAAGAHAPRPDRWAQLAMTLLPQQIAVMAARHREEIGRLGQTPRLIAAWRRYSGAAWIEEVHRLAAAEEGARLPETIAGRAFADCVRRFASVLRRHASAELVRDAERFLAPLSRLGGLGFDELLPL